MRAAVVALFLIGCGRIGFDPLDEEDPGPFRQVQLPAGGAAHAFAYSRDGSTRYITVRYQRVYRSDDGGATWIPCARVGGGYSIAVDADDNVYLSGDEDVLVSTDRCRTYTPAGIGYAPILTAVGDVVYAGTYGHLVRHDTTGWHEEATPLDGQVFKTVASTADGSIVLAGTDAGIVRSDNGGAWQLSNTGLPSPQIVQTLSLGLTANGITPAYAAIGSDAAHPSGTTVCSTDGGVNWTQCQGVSRDSIAADPTVQDRVLFTYEGVYESTNRLATIMSDYRSPEMALAHADVLRFTPSGSIALSTERGLFEADTAFAWHPLFGNLQTWRILDVAADGTDVWAATRSGVLHSTNGAAFEVSISGWTQNSDDGVVEYLEDAVWAGTRYMRRSSDRGKTWSEIYDPSAGDGSRINAFAAHAGVMYAGTGTRVLSSSPPYSTWTPHSLAGADHPTKALAWRNDELWVGCEDGLFVSRDLAGTFTQVSADHVEDLAVLADGQLVVAGKGVMVGDPTTASRFAADVNVHHVAIRGDVIAAVTDERVFISPDRGGTWRPLHGLDTRGPYGVAFDATTGDLLVGTYGNGLWRAPMH